MQNACKFICLQTAHGLQLWVNLAAKDKMSEPRYQELKAEEIPHVTQDGVTAIVIAGEAFGVQSPVYTLNPTYYLHFIMQPHSKLQQKVGICACQCPVTFNQIPSNFNSFIYVLEGQAEFGDADTRGEAHHTVNACIPHSTH